MSQVLKDRLLSLQNSFAGLTIPAVLEKLSGLFPGAVTLSTSFSNEDQVITDFISKIKTGISIFTLDTGRLFPETYSTWSRTLEHYKIKIKAFYPDKKQLQVFVTDNGPNAFYESVALRKQCCYIRKVVPLRKALVEKTIWITGLRAEHSPAREALSVLEWDEANQVIKYNPLLHWTTEEVKDYIHHHHIPYNPLHDKGFVSIGCAPCTRAIQPGEDFRAGRWWWEDGEKKECGLHLTPSPSPQVWRGEEFILRDVLISLTGEKLIVRKVEDTIKTKNLTEPKGKFASRNWLQTHTLLDAIEEFKFDTCIGGARRDEEKARAKQRIFSVRNEFGQWDPKLQRPELWNIFNGRIHKGENVRVFPID